MRVSVDTDVWGATELVLAVTCVNIRDALRFPAVRQAIVRRIQARQWLDEEKRWTNPLLQYGSDKVYSPFHVDEWAAATVTLARCGAIRRVATGWELGDPNAVLVDDCEGLSAIYAAGLILLEVPFAVWVTVTQPLDKDEAHAFNLLGPPTALRVFDGSVLGRMPQPRRGWYSQDENARIVVPTLASGRYSN